jgi:hypothetical protein
MLNNGAIDGNVEVLITSDITETGALALNEVIQLSAGVQGQYGYKIRIRPSDNTKRTITGAYGTPLISLNGADNIVFTGVSPIGTPADTNLTFASTSTFAPVFQFGNDAINDSLHNLNIVGRNTSTFSGLCKMLLANA